FGPGQRWWFTLPSHPWPFPGLEESEEDEEHEESESARRQSPGDPSGPPTEEEAHVSLVAPSDSSDSSYSSGSQQGQRFTVLADGSTCPPGRVYGKGRQPGEDDFEEF